MKAFAYPRLSRPKALSAFLHYMTAVRFSSRAIRIIVIVGALAYAGFLAWRMGAYAGGADSSGYLNQARLLHGGKVHAERRALAMYPVAKAPVFAYVPLGFSLNEHYDMVAVYPIGLPLFVAAISSMVGWRLGPHAVIWLHALAGIALFWALARTVGLSRLLTAFGALVLATSPLFLFSSLQMMSDGPALVWITAANLCAWRASHSSSAEKRWALASGIALGVAVLVRPNNLLAVAPVAIALGWCWRLWIAFVFGGSPFALALAAYNHAAYGNVFRSGYGPLRDFFRIEFAGPTLVHYAHWLPVVLTPLITLALALPWVAERRLRWSALIVAWIGAFAIFYAFYAFTDDAWWYLRFLLPSFPAWILAGLLVTEAAIEKLPCLRVPCRPVAIGAGAVVFIVSWSATFNWQLKSLNIGRNEGAYLEAIDWARAHVPSDSIFLASQTTGALYYYTDFTFVRWDFLHPDDFIAVERAALNEGRALIAMLFPFEEKPVLSAPAAGRWTKIGAVRHITFWQFDATVPSGP